MAAQSQITMLDGHMKTSSRTASSAPGQAGVTDRATADYLSSKKKASQLTLLGMPVRAGSALSKATAALHLRRWPPTWLEPVLSDLQAQRRDGWLL